jgi:hypothetical protein
MAAARVDVTHHTTTDPSRVVVFDDFADHLVTEHAAVVHVAARELQIGVAHAGEAHTDERFAGWTIGSGDVRAESNGVFEYEGAHAAKLPDDQP